MDGVLVSFDLEIRKLIIVRLKTEKRQHLNNTSGLYFSADTTVSNRFMRTLEKLQQCNFLSSLNHGFSRKSSESSHVTGLLLSFWNLFNEDPGHGRPACVCVSILVASVTTSNPESHSHLSLVDVITVTFNMAVTVKIVVLAGSHVERTVNGARRAALGAIEGEIPTTTADVTISNPEATRKVNMEGSVCEVLHKVAVLQR